MRGLRARARPSQACACARARQLEVSSENRNAVCSSLVLFCTVELRYSDHLLSETCVIRKCLLRELYGDIFVSLHCGALQTSN